MPDTAAALLGDNGAPAAPAAGVAPTAQPSANSVWTAAFDEDTSAYVSNKGWKGPSDLLMVVGESLALNGLLVKCSRSLRRFLSSRGPTRHEPEPHDSHPSTGLPCDVQYR